MVRPLWQVILEVVGNVVGNYNWLCHAFLLDNHYHISVETQDSTLYRGIRQLNCVLPRGLISGIIKIRPVRSAEKLVRADGLHKQENRNKAARNKLIETAHIQYGYTL